jgi:hypothetical protein
LQRVLSTEHLLSSNLVGGVTDGSADEDM